jgi:hypothetical protein
MNEEMREPMMTLYADALDLGSEGALRYLAGRFDDWFSEDIEHAMENAGWEFGQDINGRIATRAG